MISLGRKLNDVPGMAISIMKGDDMEDKEHFPSVYVDAGEELDKCKLGEMVTLKGKVTSKRVSESDDDDKKRVCLDIEVHELEPTEKGSDESEEEEKEPKNHAEAVKKGLKKAEKEKENDDEY